MTRRIRRNPRTEIQSDWPREMWQWGPKPTHAHWTSYPTYAYQQFYRMNPRPDEEFETEEPYVQCVDCGETIRQRDAWETGQCLRCYNESIEEIPAPRRRHKARRNSEVDVPTSSWEAKPVPWKYALNAGPFLPQMFPYGQGGRPYVYANPKEEEEEDITPLFKPQRGVGFEEITQCSECRRPFRRRHLWQDTGLCIRCYNQTLEELPEYPELADDYPRRGKKNARSNRGRRGGFTPSERGELPNWYFLKPESRGWPAGDPRRGVRDDMHAMEVIRYMNRGFGSRGEYPRLIKSLAERYPVSDRANKEIWAFYQRAFEGISRMADRRMPTVSELR